MSGLLEAPGLTVGPADEELSPLQQEILAQRQYVLNLCVKKIHGVAARHCVAEDLTQEILMKAIRNSNKFRGTSKVRTWIHRIAINRIISFFRRVNGKRRGQINEVSVPDIILEEVANLHYVVPASTVHMAMLRNDLTVIIDNLNEPQRTILRLYRAGLKIEEIANATGFKVTSVKYHLHEFRLSTTQLQ